MNMNAHAEDRYESLLEKEKRQLDQVEIENRPGIQVIAPVEMTEKEIPPPENKSLTVDGYRYLCATSRKAQEPVTNFIITPLLLLRDNREPKRVMKLTNVHNESTTICIPVKKMKPADFAAEVEGKGNYVPSFSNGQFALIKEYLYQHEEAAEEISVLGYQPDTGYFAFSNGVFDGKNFYSTNKYGIAKIGDRAFYLPAFSEVNDDAEKEFHNERKFIFKAGSSDFSRWARQIQDVFGDNGKVGICFVVAAIFSDVIFAHTNCFPLLFLFGPAQTGKTTFRRALKGLFGNYGPNDAIGLESASSPKGFSRKLAQIRNGLEVFEEYKNRISPQLIGMLKNVYDRVGYERAQMSNDNKTHATLVNSAVIVAGQEMPTKENALFTRVIMLTFEKTNFSDDQVKAFYELEDMISDGFGMVLLQILQHRKFFEKEFPKEYARVYNELRADKDLISLKERTITNMASLLAPFRVLSERLHFPFSEAEILSLLKAKIQRQQDLMSKTDEVNQFWLVLNYLILKSEISANWNFIIDGEDLQVHMDSVYPKYFEQAGKQGINALDQTTLESYLVMQPYFRLPKAESDKGRLKGRVRINGNQRRCFRFDIEGMKPLYLDFLHKEEPNTGLTNDNLK